MKRLQRWNVGQYNYHGAPYSGGKWCASNDVSDLEAINAELLEAAERVVERWDSPHWGWSDEHTSVLIHQLRAAIAKAKGEQL